MNKLLQRLVLTAAFLLPVGMAVAADARTNAPLDLRIPDLRSVSMPDPITTSTDSQEVEDISVISASLPEGTSNLEVSRAGLGSLYWASRRPAARTWRLVFPVTPDDAPIVYQDLRVQCALARPLADQAGCP